MTFSQFAQTLYPFFGNKESVEDFVILLVNKIMGGKPGRMHGDGERQNPLFEKERRSLRYYFDGERTITPRDAGVILSSIDRYKFEEFIRKNCSEDAQQLLRTDLDNIEPIPNGDIAEICTDLFVDILHSLSKLNKS